MPETTHLTRALKYPGARVLCTELHTIYPQTALRISKSGLRVLVAFSFAESLSLSPLPGLPRSSFTIKSLVVNIFSDQVPGAIAGDKVCLRLTMLLLTAVGLC